METVQEMTEKKSRRDQILEATLSLVQTSDRWSLAEIAAKIGVSKTAIYRHFGNRAEIEDALNMMLHRDLLETFKGAGSTPDELRAAFVGYFRSHPGHLFLLMHNIFSKEQYDQDLYALLLAESPAVAGFSRMVAGKTAEEQAFVNIALLKNITSVLIAGFVIEGIEPMQEELVRILGRGLPGMIMPADGRFDELEALSIISGEELPEAPKLFTAIAASIKEYGISGTTIERIAEKMGTAKSSLYFYFRNKSEMLNELVKKETETIISLCENRAEKGTNLAEQLFVVMSVQANYLLLKPEILAVFNWIRYETIRQPNGSQHQDFDIDRFLKPYRLEGIPGGGRERKMRAVGLIKWASILSTSTIIQGKRLDADEHTSRKNIRRMFCSMLGGDKGIL